MHERGPASGGAELDAAGAQHCPDRCAGPAGEQLNVMQAEPAALVHVGDKADGELWCGVGKRFQIGPASVTIPTFR